MSVVTDKQFYILLGLGAVVLYVASKKAGAVVEAVNPLNNENAIYTGLNDAVGADNVATVADYYFGAWDLINPFNESDEYAKKVWGFSE